ncbi:hypothetical protein NDU88_004187 [Pleurodeles waltl]|uniref:Uncharacterized protein n=1 Tax=Pleurodeles waltl TaxID=8319 RepID=A0AAV7V0P6_PLEWA|nr:hypothetical protein NDU88_004187 [Pleurodeles waltl]
MAGYEDQTDDGYYLDESSGSFEQDLVNVLDAGVRHTVNQALAQAIKPIKHHLIGFAEQQGWVAASGVQSIIELSLSGGPQSIKQSHNPHSADFENLIRAMAKEHDYNALDQKEAASDLASSSSDHSSEQGDDPSRKRKKKSHHQEGICIIRQGLSQHKAAASVHLLTMVVTRLTMGDTTNDLLTSAQHSLVPVEPTPMKPIGGSVWL